MAVMAGRVRWSVGRVVVVLVTLLAVGGVPLVSAAARPPESIAPADARARDPVVGRWLLGGVAPIAVTGGDGRFAGILEADLPVVSPVEDCRIPAGVTYWTMQRSGTGTYHGTALWMDNATCTLTDERATFAYSEEYGNRILTVTLPRVGVTYAVTGQAGGDTSAPRLEIVPRSLEPGPSQRVQYRVRDDSARAQVTWTLYSDGADVRQWVSDGLEPATGTLQRLTIRPVAGAPGPYFLCGWAKDEAGNTTSKAPRSACVWLPLQVSLAGSSVINGCGADQRYDFVEQLQALLLNSQTYGPVATSFVEACNIHDAGYSGITVFDPVSRRLIDFRRWTRAEVDALFLKDMRTLCSRQIPWALAAERQVCRNGLRLMAAIADLPSTDQVGAFTYYTAVRQAARDAFDTNATVPGVQTDSMPSTWPRGGGRNNR